MEYTTAFIKETLRIYPPVAESIPRFTASKIKIGDYEIDKEMLVVCS